MSPNLRRILGGRRGAGIWAGLVLAAAGGWYLSQPSDPVPPLDPGYAWTEVGGVRIAGHVLDQADAARQAFGFDIRGAGLLPVRLAVDNRGAAVARIDAPQTFLVDEKKLAWPLLTADQARARLQPAIGSDRFENRINTAFWKIAPDTLTGFSVDLPVRGVPHPEGIGGGVPRGGFSRIRGISSGSLESLILRHLVGKSLRIPKLPPGQSAEGYLLFPGRADETGKILSVRLGLALDGDVRVVQIPKERL